MFPSEIVILMAIALTGEAGKKLLTRPADVMGEYIGYLYDSLVTRGYLKKNSCRSYQLTLKGSQVLLEFLNENKTKAREAVKTLQQLRIETSQEINKLGKELIKVE